MWRERRTSYVALSPYPPFSSGLLSLPPYYYISSEASGPERPEFPLIGTLSQQGFLNALSLFFFLSLPQTFPKLYF